MFPLTMMLTVSVASLVVVNGFSCARAVVDNARRTARTALSLDWMVRMPSLPLLGSYFMEGRNRFQKYENLDCSGAEQSSPGWQIGAAAPTAKNGRPTGAPGRPAPAPPRRLVAGWEIGSRAGPGSPASTSSPDCFRDPKISPPPAARPGCGPNNRAVVVRLPVAS